MEVALSLESKYNKSTLLTEKNNIYLLHPGNMNFSPLGYFELFVHEFVFSDEQFILWLIEHIGLM